jgi:hypothetical protein
MNNALEELRKVLLEASNAQNKTEVLIEIKKDSLVEEETIVQKTARFLNTSRDNDKILSVPQDIETQRWNDPLRKETGEKFVTFKEMNDHYRLFLQRIQKQMSTIGGGGEVKFRNLDDVNRSTLSPSNNNWVLEYNTDSKKVQFTNKIGPIDRLNFDLNHAHDEAKVVGTLCWNQEDQTLNIEHPGGVTQQVGQELYAYVRNRSGSTIQNGTVVRFDGAEENGTARLLITPMLADGSFPTLYILGIATQDIADGQDGKVTVWGKLRNVDTSDYNVGDILYASPLVTGGLTNIKPTAPNNVIPVAAVLTKDQVTGEIFIRPTIEQQQLYGRFAKTTDQIPLTINTAYPITFDDTEISNGIIIGTPTSHITVSQSGFYQFDVSTQVTATSNKGIVYFWFRKNGIDIPYSSRRNTITNGDTFTISFGLQISLDANEYVEIVWAASAGGILLDANPTPSIGPSVASVILSVAQIQL